MASTPAVAAIGSISEANSSQDFSSLTIYLEPNEVEFLVQAQKFGELTIVLRNPSEAISSSGEHSGMTQNEFLDDPRIRDVYENDLFKIRGEINAKH